MVVTVGTFIFFLLPRKTVWKGRKYWHLSYYLKSFYIIFVIFLNKHSFATHLESLHPNESNYSI
jgi:hypothetical protein